MASSWGVSWGLSWNGSWGRIEADVKRIEGYGNSPEARKKRPQPSSGIFSEKLLTSELEARLFESETELEQIIKEQSKPLETRSNQTATQIDVPALPGRAIDLQAAIAKIKAEIAATLKAEADRKRKVRQARDNKDLTEFMMMFSTFVTGKGTHGQFMGNAPQCRDTEGSAA